MQTSKKMYLSWVNDFVTLPKFAEHYNLTNEQAEKIINIGRIRHEIGCLLTTDEIERIILDYEKIRKEKDIIKSINNLIKEYK